MEKDTKFVKKKEYLEYVLEVILKLHPDLTKNKNKILKAIEECEDKGIVYEKIEYKGKEYYINGSGCIISEGILVGVKSENGEIYLF